AEHLPKIAQQMKRMAIIRSMSTKEADHSRATYLLRTGRTPGGPIQYPAFGSVVARELESPEAELPGFVAIGPARFLSAAAWSPGFLGPRYAPLIVGENAGFQFAQPGADPTASLKVQDLDRPAPVNREREGARLGLLSDVETDFLADRSGATSQSHRTAY